MLIANPTQFPVLHDDDEIPARVFEPLDVGRRFTVNEPQNRKRVCVFSLSVYNVLELADELG